MVLGQRSSQAQRWGRAFTLLEVMIALVVIAILTILGMASFKKIRTKAELVQCSSNLKSLYLATSGYITDNKQWPQIKVGGGNAKKYTRDWIEALRPYKVDERSWICPTFQRGLNKPDLTDKENWRLDYLPTPFGSHPNRPFQWSTQPWFVEAGNGHGNGNLLIFMDGSIRPLSEFAALPKK